MLPFATLSGLETAAIRQIILWICVKFLMELEWEHSAPTNDEIPSEGVDWWQCGKPGSTPTQTVLPIVAVAKLTRVVREGGD